MSLVRAAAAASTISGLETRTPAVVLPHPEEREADLVGEHRLIDDVADRLRVADELAGGVARHVAERVESEFESSGSMRVIALLLSMRYA